VPLGKMSELTLFTAELVLSLRISRPHQLGIMIVPVQRQGYLMLAANHRTTNNQAEIYMISTWKLRQIWSIVWSLLPPSLLNIVLANFESIPLQAQYAFCLIQISLRISLCRFSYLIVPQKLSNAGKTHSMCKQLCFEWRHRSFSDETAY